MMCADCLSHSVLLPLVSGVVRTGSDNPETVVFYRFQTVTSTESRQSRVKVCERHTRRQQVFEGDKIELDFATRKIQEVALHLVHRFRSIGRAYEELFGADATGLSSRDAANKLAKVLKLNPLDKARVSELMASISNVITGRDHFLELFSCTAPVHNLEEFKKRLAKEFGQVETAWQVLRMSGDDISVD
jgi:hypothetical protein